jgi:hypothetical protein
MAGGQQSPGPDLKVRQWPALEVGVVLVFALVIAASAFMLGAWRSGDSGATASQSMAASSTPTDAPPLGLVAGTYMCGSTAFVADAHPATTIGSEGNVPHDALNTLTARLPGILPASGWQIWSGSADHYVFVAPNDKTQAKYAFVELRQAGTNWLAMSYGDCEPAAGNSGFVVAQWYVTSPATAADSTVKVQFQLDFCRNTLVGTTIWYSTTNVTVTMWARPLDPAQTAACASPSFAPAAYSISLGEPLGDRQLLVGPGTAAKPAKGTPTAGPTPPPTKSPKATKA